jgi:hypothetical protein
MRNYIVLTGGLGNQLFQIAGALSNSTTPVHVVSCLGNPRTFLGKLEISQLNFSGQLIFEECNKDHRIAKKMFAVMLSSATRRKSLQENALSRVFLAILGAVVFSFQLRDLVLPRISKGIGFDAAFASRRGNFFVGYFQTYRMTERAKRVIKGAFDDSSSLRSVRMDDKPDLVIHSRLGDYRKEVLFGVLDSDYFSKAISLVKKDSDLEKIWLFSDEPKLAFELMPIDFRRAIVEIGRAEDAPSAILKTMMSGDRFVISNSTFSWWAAFLVDSLQVVVPTPWFAKGEMPIDLIPEVWKTVRRT